MTDMTTAPAAEQDAGAVVSQPRDELGRFVPAQNEGAEASEAVEQAAPAVEGEASPTPDAEDKPDPRRERSRQRWQDMKAKVKEAQSQAAHWKAVAEKRWAEANSPVDPNAYQTDAEYQAALSAQAMRKVTAQDHYEQAQTMAHQAEYAARQAVAVQAEALKDSIPDIRVIFSQPEQGGPMMTPEMFQVIQESDNAALIAYHLAKNPDQAYSICRMSPLAAARELGKLESKLKPPVRRISKAPAPVQTVSGGSGQAGVNPETLSFADYEKWRMGQSR